MKSIVMFNINETTRDPRVRRIAATLVSAGYRVAVVNPLVGDAPAVQRYEGYEIHRVPVPSGYSDDDATVFARFCPAVARIAGHHDPRILPGVWRVFLARNRLRVENRLRMTGVPLRDYRDDPEDAARAVDVLRIRWLLLASRVLFEAGAALRPDIAWSNDLDTLLAGSLLRRRGGIPLVYDAHEIYAEQFADHLRSDLWHDFYVDLETHLLRETDGRLTVCDSLGEYFVGHYGSRPFLTVRNCPRRALIASDDVIARRNSPRRVLYHGAYFRYRGLEEVIQASRRVQGCRFIFRGFGEQEQELRRLAEDTGVADRVQFVEPVSVDELIPLASECDIGLNPFISVCRNTEYALPNKFFEYAAAGLALVSADLPEMRRLTQAHDMGMLFDSSDPEALAQVLNDLLAAPARLDEFRANALRAARENFTWEREEEALLAYVNQVTGVRPG